MTYDCGFVMSLQGISVPGSGSNSICFMFRSGLHYDTDQPTIALTACPQVVPVSSTFFVSLSLSDPLVGEILGLFFVSDWDVSGISRVVNEVTAGHYDFPEI
jgi:hypothetical protein